MDIQTREMSSRSEGLAAGPKSTALLAVRIIKVGETLRIWAMKTDEPGFPADFPPTSEQLEPDPAVLYNPAGVESLTGAACHPPGRILRSAGLSPAFSTGGAPADPVRRCAAARRGEPRSRRLRAAGQQVHRHDDRSDDIHIPGDRAAMAIEVSARPRTDPPWPGAVELHLRGDDRSTSRVMVVYRRQNQSWSRPQRRSAPRHWPPGSWGRQA